MAQLKDIRLVALDLDDTTLMSDGSLADKTREAIEAAIGAGIEIVVASGRAFNSLPESVCSIPGVRYAITSNGAATVSNPGGERIFSLALHPKEVLRVLELFDGELMEAFIDGQAYCDSEYLADPERYGCSSRYVSYVQTTRLPQDDMRSFMLLNIERLDSVDIMCASPEHKTRLWEKTALLTRSYVTSSSPRLIEISDRNAGKGAALRRLTQTLGISPQNVAAFGNGDNDADMLVFAGLGAAVENASESCRAAADIICPSNDEHGVAKILYRIIEEKHDTRSKTDRY